MKRREEWKTKFSINAEEFSKRLQAMGTLAKANQNITVNEIDDSLFLVS
jgi:hypothetical protein